MSDPQADVPVSLTPADQYVRSQGDWLHEQRCDRFQASERQPNLLVYSLVDVHRVVRTLRDQVAEQAETITRLTAERDKWLDAFNRSEQFQNGPAQRVKELQAERDAFRAALQQIVEVIDGPQVTTRDMLRRAEALGQARTLLADTGAQAQ